MRAPVAVYHLHTYTHKKGRREVGGGVERDEYISTNESEKK